MYLQIAEKSYKQKLAFVFLNEVAAEFQVELQNTYGSAGNVDYGSKIETIENMYSFTKFGKYCSHSQ